MVHRRNLRDRVIVTPPLQRREGNGVNYDPMPPPPVCRPDERALAILPEAVHRERDASVLGIHRSHVRRTRTDTRASLHPVATAAWIGLGPSASALVARQRLHQRHPL